MFRLTTTRQCIPPPKMFVQQFRGFVAKSGKVLSGNTAISCPISCPNKSLMIPLEDVSLQRPSRQKVWGHPHAFLKIAGPSDCLAVTLLFRSDFPSLFGGTIFIFFWFFLFLIQSFLRVCIPTAGSVHLRPEGFKQSLSYTNVLDGAGPVCYSNAITKATWLQCISRMHVCTHPFSP